MFLGPPITNVSNQWRHDNADPKWQQSVQKQIGLGFSLRRGRKCGTNNICVDLGTQSLVTCCYPHSNLLVTWEVPNADNIADSVDPADAIASKNSEEENLPIGGRWDLVCDEEELDAIAD
ncbi:hypothetical protein Pyn_16299 [Prunus yedoensis var. nudiflora]|uniref:Uncharacterized protein n=1 Tax=Prunus yedoensis var. nudiflora TaxID=2094558 RepID=A0A314ZL46_PRUYE|nr:hypothetical protein Pyn_16299 [Prunus yedoensis var. nudiflora]